MSNNHHTSTRAPLAGVIELLAAFGIGLYAILVILYIVGRELMEPDHSIVAALHNMAPLLGPIGIVLLIIALLSRWRGLLVLLLAPGLIAFAVWYGPLLAPAPEIEAPPGSVTLQVASFNILSPSSQPERIPEAIRDMGEIDLIGLQELGPDHAQAIETELADRFAYRVLEPRTPENVGVGLLSRYPITDYEIYQPRPDSLLHMRATVDVNGIPIVVYVIHPRPPQHRTNPLKYSSQLRDEELEVTFGRLAEEDPNAPILLLCDCNMPDQSTAYARMDGYLDDAFRKVGWGLGLTFPAYREFVPSLLRLDYIWYSARFTALSSETSADPGTSDHRPIQAELALTRAAAVE